MEIEEIVNKLIGATRGCGESNEDGKRLKNIKVLIELAESLTDRLVVIAADKECYEHSVKIIGKEADDYLSRLRSRFE